MYYLLAVSIIFASLNSILLNRARLKGKSPIFFFNFLVSAVWCIILVFLNKVSLQLNSSILFWGILYGVVQSLFVLFKTLAMGSGPVSVTTLIGNSSLLVSVTVSLIAWKEKFSLPDIVGIVVLFVAIALCTYKKDTKNYSRLWGSFSAIFFCFASCTGLTFKAFGKSDVSDYCSDMMIVASITMLVAYSLLSLFVGGIKEVKPALRDKRFMLFALLCGILSCVYNRLNIFLAGKIDAVIFFPSFNGGVVLLSALLGLLICKEKLNAKQIIGILIGAASIAIIGIF